MWRRESCAPHPGKWNIPGELIMFFHWVYHYTQPSIQVSIISVGLWVVVLFLIGRTIFFLPSFPHHLLLSHSLLVSKDCGSKCNGLHFTKSVELDFCNCLDGFWEWYCYASCRWSGSLSEAEGRERVGWGEAVSTFLLNQCPSVICSTHCMQSFLPLPTTSWLSGDSWHVAEEIYTNVSCKIEMAKFWKMGSFDGTGVTKK